MKNFKLHAKTAIIGYILLATVLFTSCESEEISSLKKENADLRDKIIFLEIKVDRLNKMNDVTQNQLIKLAQQDNNTLDLISNHLKYNHGF